MRNILAVILLAAVVAVAYGLLRPSGLSASDIASIPLEPEKPITQVMDVQKAYDAIPHMRVTFNPARTALAPDEAAYLHQLFDLTDMAVIERVETIRYFSGKTGADNRNSMEIIRRMQALPTPEKLRPVYEHILLAVYEQKQLFDLWRQDQNFQFSANAPHVGSISNHLHEAYNLLMRLYPDETSHNKNAFYQHLCALDNI